MAKVRTYVLLPFIILAAVYFSGPIVSEPVIGTELPTVESDLVRLESQIADGERSAGIVKPDNEARIVWADSTKKEATPFSVVYLHGFEGSQGDGSPVHREFARRYGCNLYLSRLYGHGLETEDALHDLTPGNYLESAMRAVSIGGKLGRKVILMATSTGATLALIIASRHPEIAGLILYSPNIDFYKQSTSVLVMHWGVLVGECVHGGKYVVYDDPDSVRKYWLSKFRLDGVAAAKCLIDHEMNAATFANIHQPTFVGYYYKNDAEQDMQVSVPRILEMAGQLGTPAAAKRMAAFPHVGVHPLASSLMSKDVNAVRTETFRFAEEVMHLSPIGK